jgi:hypothetical protein
MAPNNEESKTKKGKTVISKVLESILPNFDYFVFTTFAVELGHFKVQTILYYATNTQA